MAILSKPSSAAGMSIAYITTGALLCVWGVVWMLYLRTVESASSGIYYVCTGIILSGMTLLVIGLALGRIGRSARRAELPPPEVPPTATATEPAVIIRPSPPAPTVPVASPAPIEGTKAAGR